MDISVIGFNHSNTPLGIRGKLSIASEKKKDSIQTLKMFVPQTVILSTCNRVEFYFLGGNWERLKILDYLETTSGLKREIFEKYLYRYEGKSAISHLFEVACGLDSMILGEHEILGQVKTASQFARDFGNIEYTIAKLFSEAVRVGRKVRNETGISRNAQSVSSAALELASKNVNQFSLCKALVIGAGEAGKLVAKVGKERGLSNITVVSRSRQKALNLVNELRAEWVPISDLYQEMEKSDLVISCTGAPHYVIKTSMVKNLMENRANKPLVLIDIAVPQDIEPSVKEVEGVFFYDIDALNQVIKCNHDNRKKEAESARLIISLEAEKFHRWWQNLNSKSLISSLVSKGKNVKELHLRKTLPKLRNISEREKEYIEAMADSIVAKILHGPIASLKNGQVDDGRISLLKEMFNLDSKEN